jgi:Fe-S-cluster containining protein
VKKPKASIVPCGSCSLCCQGDAIIIHKDFGDRVSDYDCVRWNGLWKIRSKDNGDCIYLDRAKGCTIHHKRPAVCREFDCRGLVRRLGDSPMLRRAASSDVVARGLELIEQEKG